MDGLLARLRGRIRAYVWVQGLAACVAFVGLAFWVSLLLDQPWAFEWPRAVRAGLLVFAALGLLWVAYRLIARRAFARLPRRSMAMLLERRYQGFGDSLLTAVELSDRDPDEHGYSPEMLAHTRDMAQHRAADVDLGQVFDIRPLGHAVVAGIFLTGSIVVFALTQPQAFGTWTRRNLLLSDELWPRRTELLVEGFQDGVARIARGSDFTVLARANMAKVVPSVVQVRYRTDEGFRARENMTQDGVARPGVDPYQQFSHTFQGVLTPIRLDVVGGDDRRRDLRIEVVDSPTFAQMFLECEFPAYMRRGPRSLPVTGAMQLPEGTKVVLRAVANKDLVQVEVQSAESSEGASASPQQFSARTIAISPDDPRAFRFDLGTLSADRGLLFTLLDTDGIRNRDPLRLALGVTPDQPPRVDVQLRGIGSAVTPRARLPVAGELSDDYGLNRAWYEYIVDEGTEGAQPRQRPLAAGPRGRDLFKLSETGEEALDLRDHLTSADNQRLELKAGQKLLISVKASDAYDLGEAPHVGSGQRSLLDVVTPDQLRTLLESRELNLRRRFETIIEEVTETSDTLLLLDLASLPEPDATEPDATEPDATEPDATEPDATAADAESRDLPDAAEAAAEESSGARAAELTALRVERCLQNSRKNAQETLGVATGFDDISAELVNNRVDTEELRTRLADGISAPLKHIALDLFPELEARMEALRGHLGDQPQATADRDAARRQVEIVLVEMRQVLNKMLELETFNEALAMLRSIIEAQDKLSERTEQLRRQSARDLLEE
jgi:hypothetical protein